MANLVIKSWEEFEPDAQKIADLTIQLVSLRCRGTVPDFGGYDFSKEIHQSPMMTDDGIMVSDGNDNIHQVTLDNLLHGAWQMYLTKRFPGETNVSVFYDPEIITPKLTWLVQTRIKMLPIAPEEPRDLDDDEKKGGLHTPYIGHIEDLNPGLSNTSWKFNQKVDLGPKHLNARKNKNKQRIQNDTTQEVSGLFDELEKKKCRRYDLLISFFKLEDDQSEDLYRSIQEIEMINFEILSGREYLQDLCERYNLRAPDGDDWIEEEYVCGDYEEESPFELAEYEEEGILCSDEEGFLETYVPQEFGESNIYLWRDISEPNDQGETNKADWLKLNLKRNNRTLERMLIVYFFAYSTLLKSKVKSDREITQIKDNLACLQGEISDVRCTIDELEAELREIRLQQGDDTNND